MSMTEVHPAETRRSGKGGGGGGGGKKRNGMKWVPDEWPPQEEEMERDGEGLPPWLNRTGNRQDGGNKNKKRKAGMV